MGIGEVLYERLVALNTLDETGTGRAAFLDMEVEESDEIGELFRSFGYMTKELRKLMLEQYRLGKNVKRRSCARCWSATARWHTNPARKSKRRKLPLKREGNLNLL